MSTTTRRAYTIDSSLRTTASRHGRDSAGPAQRTLVASFFGSGFIAEREGDELKVYAVTGEPFATSTTGDAARRPMSVADLQKINEAKYPRHDGYAK